MLKTHFHKNIVWYDFLQPSREKFLPLAEKLKIDPYIIEKFLLPTNRDKALILGDHLFLSISIPDFKNGEYEKQELKFIIGKKYIITATNSKNEGIEFFKSIFEDNAHFQKSEEFASPVVYTFLHMMEKVYENMIFELKNLEKEVDLIEKEIFSGREAEMVKEISRVNRKVIDFGKNISGHQETWDVFLALAKDFFNNPQKYDALESITLSFQKVMSEWTHLKETIHELRDTNNSLLNSKLGETSKTFTLIAFLTLPITLFASILSIPTKQKHFLGNSDYDFIIIIFVSIALSLIMLAISKWKRWW